jgi:hypothetical protein
VVDRVSTLIETAVADNVVNEEAAPVRRGRPTLDEEAA